MESYMKNMQTYRWSWIHFVCNKDKYIEKENSHIFEHDSEILRTKRLRKKDHEGKLIKIEIRISFKTVLLYVEAYDYPMEIESFTILVTLCLRAEDLSI